MGVRAYSSGTTRSSSCSTSSGVLAGREAGAVGDPEDMGVDRDGRLAERDVEHDIRGLAPDARQSLERLALARHLAAVRSISARERPMTFFALLR